MPTNKTKTDISHNTRLRTTTITTHQIMKLELEGAGQLTTILIMNEKFSPLMFY